jgi:hypothetical protein
MKRGDDIAARTLSIVAASIIAVVILSALIAWGLVNLFGGRGPEGDRAAMAAAFPTPRLDVRPTQDLREYQAQEKAKVSQYRWIDRTAGVVQIPIEQAMTVLAGQPVRKSGETPIGPFRPANQ